MPWPCHLRLECWVFRARSSVPCRVRRLQLLKQLLTVLVPRDQNRGQQSQPKHIHQTETRPPLSAFWRCWLFRRIDKIIKANQPLPNRSMNYFESEKRLNRRSLSGQFRKDFLCPIRQTSFLLTQTAMKHGTPRGQPRITVVQKTERVVLRVCTSLIRSYSLPAL